MDNAIRDLRLVGSSEAAGGRFRNLRVTGDADLAGDVRCERFSLTGTVAVRGELTSQNAGFTGEVRVQGAFRGGRMRGTGELEIGGACRCEDIRLNGRLAARGEVEAETLDIRGALEAESGVSADRLQLRLLGPSFAREVTGGELSVRRSRALRLKELFRSGTDVGFQAGLIEGDNIYLEFARADVVRGNHVALGPGCDIGLVEYRGSFEGNAGSKAADVRKI